MAALPWGHIARGADGVLRRSTGTRGGGAVLWASGAGLGQRGRAVSRPWCAVMGAVGCKGGFKVIIDPGPLFQPSSNRISAGCFLPCASGISDSSGRRIVGTLCLRSQKQSVPAPKSRRAAQGRLSGVARTLLQTLGWRPGSFEAPGASLGPRKLRMRQHLRGLRGSAATPPPPPAHQYYPDPLSQLPTVLRPP